MHAYYAWPYLFYRSVTLPRLRRDDILHRRRSGSEKAQREDRRDDRGENDNGDQDRELRRRDDCVLKAVERADRPEGETGAHQKRGEHAVVLVVPAGRREDRDKLR